MFFKKVNKSENMKFSQKKKRKKKIDYVGIIITFGLTILAFITIFPVVNLLMVSLSDANFAANVFLLPIGLNFDSYSYIFAKDNLFTSLLISTLRVIVGTALQTVVAVFVAYALSKNFKGRTLYAWFFFLGMIFDGGVIPFYMLVRGLGMYNTFASLVIPSTVQVFNIILLTNFFKELPKEIEESASMDGANPISVLFKIVLPMSKPVLATSIILSMVGHWNAWLDGVMFISLPDNYPLATLIQAFITGGNIGSNYPERVSGTTANAALVIFGMLPMVIAYPFLQKYFKKGMLIGGVKG